MQERLGRTHYPVGEYTEKEIGAVTKHANDKGIGYSLVQGPMSNFILEDGTKVTVLEGKTAVVLITRDEKAVNDFWDGFKRDNFKLPKKRNKKSSHG
jgi:hypothetical protein